MSLVIVGPTASGKSALAFALAELWKARGQLCEIVSVDAMAVYRRMDIGTAKPSVSERSLIAHHMIDLVEPAEEYEVARFQTAAQKVLADIAQRGNRALLVGGTGLYVRAIVDDLNIPGRFPDERAELERCPDTQALWQRLQEVDPRAASKILPNNRRRIVRALEVSLGSGKPFSAYGSGLDHYGPSTFKMIGLELERAELDIRIDRRYDQQMEDGFLVEVQALASEGLSPTAAQALGYKELLAHLRGELSLEQALADAKQRTRRFARRQQRWFRRDPRIVWFDASSAELVELVDAWVDSADSGAVGESVKGSD